MRLPWNYNRKKGCFDVEGHTHDSFILWKLFWGKHFTSQHYQQSILLLIKTEKKNFQIHCFFLIKKPIFFSTGLQALNISCRTWLSCKRTWLHDSAPAPSYCYTGKRPKALFEWLIFSKPFSMIPPQILTAEKTEMRLYWDIKLKHCKNISFLAAWFLIRDKKLLKWKIYWMNLLIFNS